jgi:hypothetical protein
MSYFNTVNIQDAENTTVNPATEEKQDAGNTSLSAIETGQTSGAQKTQISNSAGDPVNITSENTDADSNTANTLQQTARLSGFNGTTWDRVRTGVKGIVSSLLGYLNVIPIGTYNSTPPTLTDGQSVEPQIDASGNLKVNIISSAPTTPASDVTTTGSIQNISEAVTAVVGNYNSIVTTLTGTWTGTLIGQVSSDNGVSWQNTFFFGEQNVPPKQGHPAFLQTLTENGIYRPLIVGGVTHFRVVATETVTGTISVNILTSVSMPGVSLTSSQILQNVLDCKINSSTANLSASGSFVGTGVLVTGISGIRVSLKTDQPCTVQVQQSPDNSNWDVIDTYSTLPNVGAGWTVQAISSYFRVVVLNTGTAATTYFRLKTTLCPVVEALPRSLSADGRLRVEATFGTAKSNIPLQLVKEGVMSPIVTGQWQDVLNYTTPSGYDLSCIAFQGSSNQAGDIIRIVEQLNLGTYNTNTGVFTDNGVWELPQFASKLYIYLTTGTGNQKDDITITYTNQSGVTNRTATFTIPKNSIAGNRWEVPLQTGDIGIIDVTAVTNTQTQTGVFTLESNITLAYLLLASSGTGYDQIFSNSALNINEGKTAIVQYLSSASRRSRRISLIGTLIPRT